MKSSNLIIPNVISCSYYVRFNNELCYHHPVCDEKFMAEVQDEMKFLLETHNHLFDSQKIEKMTIKLDPNSVLCNKEVDHIDVFLKMLWKEYH